MIISGSSRTNRTEFLICKYIELVKSGISTAEILVLVQNRHKKQYFIEKIKDSLNVLENPKIYTFFGLVYNTIKTDWTDVENLLHTGTPHIMPNLTGLEISQYLFKKCVKSSGFLDYNSKINLLHQLFRRYSLIVQNKLSEDDVKKRAEILKESFAPDAKHAIDRFKQLTLKYRTLDYIRQCAIFPHICEKSVFLKNIKYLIIDDADEITNAQLDFLKFLKPSLLDWYIGMDKNGVSRAGFLCADFSMPQQLENLFKDKVEELDRLPVCPVKVSHIQCSKYIEMIKQAFEYICLMIRENKLTPDCISVAVPDINSAIYFFAREIFGAKNIKYCILSGSEKLIDNKTVKNIITILKLAADAGSFKLSAIDIRSVFHTVFSMPFKDTLPVSSMFKESGTLTDKDIFENPEYNIKLHIFCRIIEKIKSEPLSKQAEIIFEELINTKNIETINKINFFIKQIRDFETVFEQNIYDKNFQKDIITQIENTIISENPADSPVVEPDTLCIATAQKLIDLNIKSKYQFWLDITGETWTKQDTGTIYNAWVFLSTWNKKDFTFEDNLELSAEKVKRQIRKLSLLSEEKIYAFSSLFDINGLENADGITNFLDFEHENKKEQSVFSFIPRPDQKPVLEYKKGTLAISAVPGAGKTTILLALVVNLMQSGIKPENIFVLTYMDSAARNFKERIKNICPNIDTMPNILTIHGLALRILKENSNFTKIGLSADFEVCDDTDRQRILREIISSLGLNHDDFEKYEKAISALKLSGAKQLIHPKSKEINDFLMLYKLYNKTLKARNIIDYDDMLRLALVLLEKNPDIKEHYSTICGYIIEDEAQDSSKIQQNLLKILSEKHGNLIRCGDINQSITTTFTNADMQGFLDFIKKNSCVKMECSQRCTKDVYNLANMLVEKAETISDTKNAFYKTYMKPVEGKNPVCENAVVSKLFENYQEERSYIVSKIREIYSKNKNANIAILLRNNFQIDEYSSFLAGAGFDTIQRTDSLKMQPAFRLILGLLKFVHSPWDNQNVTNIIEILTEQKLMNLSAEEKNFVSMLKTPFICKNPDELPSKTLSQLHWDLDYWLESSELPCEEFAIKAGSYYYNSDIEISNVYMISILIKKLSNQYKHDFILKLEELAQKAPSGRLKFFGKEEENQTNKSGKIMLMTYHKSKGDEFDYVFIPQLSEEILPLRTENVKIKPQERFMENIKALNPEYEIKNEYMLKSNIASENLRLFYVAITRAKLGLFITCAGKYKKFSKIKETKPSVFFDAVPVLSCR